MNVIRHDADSVNRKATLARHPQPVSAERLARSRIKDANAITRSEDQMMIQVEASVRRSKRHRRVGAIIEYRWPRPRRVAMMLGLCIEVLFHLLDTYSPDAPGEVASLPNRRHQRQLHATLTRRICFDRLDDFC